MAFADALRTSKATIETVADTIDSVLGPNGSLSISSWTPSFGATGSMDYQSVTTDYAYYFRFNEAVFFMFSVNGTTTGTASTGITVSLPVNSTMTTGVTITASFRDNTVSASEFVGRGVMNPTDDTIEVYKRDQSNWGLGSGAIVRAEGFYLTNPI